ncbi:MAG: zinc-ribbon domain-containing protein [Gemmatimonadota bacterium]
MHSSAAASSLATAYPALAAQWHPGRNGPLQPGQVAPRTSRKVWWRCSRDSRHEWEAAVKSRTALGAGCPFCSGLRVLPESSLAAVRPDLVDEWDREANGGLAPDQVAPGSRRARAWRCRSCGHRWKTSVSTRTRARGSGCPACAGTVATPLTSLAAAAPELAAEWHSDRNGGLSPEQVRPQSGKRVWWRCARNPTHEWPARIQARYRGRTGCPLCSPGSNRVAPELSLAALHPGLAGEWDPEGNPGMLPDALRPGSTYLAAWRCRGCRHAWRATVAGRVSGSGCPACAFDHRPGFVRLPVARPDLAALWHPTRNGTLEPADLAAASRRPVWWRCSVCRTDWRQAPLLIPRERTGCPRCEPPLRHAPLAEINPAVAAEWHPTLNGGLTPADVAYG